MSNILTLPHWIPAREFIKLTGWDKHRLYRERKNNKHLERHMWIKSKTGGYLYNKNIVDQVK
jgi:hypothetical protein